MEEVKAALPAALQGWLLKLQIMLLHVTNSLLGFFFFKRHASEFAEVSKLLPR